MCHRFYKRKNLSVSQDMLFGQGFESPQVHTFLIKAVDEVNIMSSSRGGTVTSSSTGPDWFRRQRKVRQSQDKRFDINLTGNNNIADYTGLKQAA